VTKRHLGLSFHVALVAIAAALAGSCHCQARYHPGGPYYYAAWVPKTSPAEPTGEVTAAEAQSMGRYFEAHFDELGHIVVFRGFLNGKQDFEEKYYYRASGKPHYKTLTKETGEVVMEYYR